jgi:hypothetical protein
VRTVTVALVGGGFRATTFLAAHPELLGRAHVYEAGPRMGAGAFRGYDCVTSTTGRRFFAPVRDQCAHWSSVLSDPRVSRVASQDDPVPMSALAEALDVLGGALAEELGDRLHTGHDIAALDVRTDHVRLTSAAGSSEVAEHAILATGRFEPRHPALIGLDAVPWLSGAVLDRDHRTALERDLIAAGDRPVIVVGCSHSALAVVALVLRLRQRLSPRPAFRIRLVRRGPVPLLHADIDAARRDHRVGRDRLATDPDDVCPATGLVFRDSGLRHSARDLYCAIWQGDIDGVDLVDVPDLDDAAAMLRDAGLVVQALGYRARVPDVLVEGRPWRTTTSPERLAVDAGGAVVIDRRASDRLHALRLEPTPPEVLNHGLYGSTLFADLANRVGSTTAAGRAA